MLRHRRRRLVARRARRSSRVALQCQSTNGETNAPRSLGAAARQAFWPALGKKCSARSRSSGQGGVLLSPLALISLSPHVQYECMVLALAGDISSQYRRCFGLHTYMTVCGAVQHTTLVTVTRALESSVSCGAGAFSFVDLSSPLPVSQYESSAFQSMSSDREPSICPVGRRKKNFATARHWAYWRALALTQVHPEKRT